MKYFVFGTLFMIFIISCKDENHKHDVEIKNAIKQRTLVFNVISKSWTFTPQAMSPEAQEMTYNWNDWRLFTSELYQKPKGTIGAYQRKTKSLVQKVDVLYNTIPSNINKPQIRARLIAIITKVKVLHTFLNLDRVPEKKISILVSDLNIEMNAFQNQIEEIVKRGKIIKEEGEQEMLNSLITSKPSAIYQEMKMDSVK